MKKLGMILLAWLLAMSTVSIAPANQSSVSQKASSAGVRDRVSGEVLVRFTPDVDTTRAEGLLLPARLSVLECIHTIRLCRMKVMDGSVVEEIAAHAGMDPRVAYSEPDYIDHTLGIPGPQLPPDAVTKEATDPRYSQQWHYRLINLPQAWNWSTGSNSQVIAVVDTGARFDHPDLAGRLSPNGYDFIDLDTNPLDPDNGHGTHVSGTIGAMTNNGLGVAGVTWRNPILPIRTIGTGGGTHFQFAQGFLYAAGLLKAPDPVNPTPAKIINYSGGGVDSSTKRDAVARVNRAGVVMVVAAGNNGDIDGAVDYPGAYSRDYRMVITVGATDYGNGSPTRAFYSSFGPSVTVVAPGGDTTVGNENGVLSTAWDFGTGRPTYEYWMGTSMATPHVTGVAALLLARGCPTSRIRPILQRSATDLGPAGFDNEYGSGLINAQAALAMTGRDLRIRSLAGFGATSRRELAGGHALFKWQVQNMGCASSPKTNIRFWLSSDTTLSADDMYLGAQAVPALTGGASTELKQVSLNLKNSVNQRQRWYVIATVDPKNAVHEFRENNNQRNCRLTDK